MSESASCDCGKQPYFPAVMRTEVNGYERIVSFKPGYRCSKTGGKSHGVHGVDLIFLVKGKEGVVQFMIYTGWLPKQKYEPVHTMAADLGYHSRKAMYEGQTSRPDCNWIGSECFYDGSGLNAQNMFDVFTVKGELAMWEELEKYYKDTFEGAASI